MKHKSQVSWILYDFANSAYHLLTITILFPLCFKQALFSGEGSSDVVWSVVVAVPILLSGLASPFIGAYIDQEGAKKRVFVILCLSTVILALGLGVAPRTTPFIPILLFCFSVFCFNVSQFVYNAFLPTQAFKKGFALLSGLGWGTGYLGGILCMPLVLIFLHDAALPDDYGAYQKAFCVVAGFFFFFALPSLLWMEDEIGDVTPRHREAPNSPLRQVLETLKNWRRNREIFKFLVSFYLINDGIATLVFFTAIFAASTLAMSTNQIMIAFLIVQGVGIPATILLCWLAEHRGYKKVLLVCVLIWVANAVGFLLVDSAKDLYALSVCVGLVIGTTPAIARAILALMVSTKNVTEIYGLHAFTGRVSAIIGPLLFGVVSWATGSQKIALSSLVVFFVSGFGVLLSVRVPAADARPGDR